MAWVYSEMASKRSHSPKFAQQILGPSNQAMRPSYRGLGFGLWGGFGKNKIEEGERS